MTGKKRCIDCGATGGQDEKCSGNATLRGKKRKGWCSSHKKTFEIDPLHSSDGVTQHQYLEKVSRLHLETIPLTDGWNRFNLTYVSHLMLQMCHHMPRSYVIRSSLTLAWTHKLSKNASLCTLECPEVCFLSFLPSKRSKLTFEGSRTKTNGVNNKRSGWGWDDSTSQRTVSFMLVKTHQPPETSLPSSFSFLSSSPSHTEKVEEIACPHHLSTPLGVNTNNPGEVTF